MQRDLRRHRQANPSLADWRSALDLSSEGAGGIRPPPKTLPARSRRLRPEPPGVLISGALAKLRTLAKERASFGFGTLAGSHLCRSGRAWVLPAAIVAPSHIAL